MENKAIDERWTLLANSEDDLQRRKEEVEDREAQTRRAEREKRRLEEQVNAMGEQLINLTFLQLRDGTDTAAPRRSSEEADLDDGDGDHRQRPRLQSTLDLTLDSSPGGVVPNDSGLQLLAPDFNSGGVLTDTESAVVPSDTRASRLVDVVTKTGH